MLTKMILSGTFTHHITAVAGIIWLLAIDMHLFNNDNKYVVNAGCKATGTSSALYLDIGQVLQKLKPRKNIGLPVHRRRRFPLVQSPVPCTLLGATVCVNTHTRTHTHTHTCTHR